MAKTIATTWELWSYDIFGNKDDGYEVNDRSCFDRSYPIRLKITHNNVGTDRAFDSAFPTEYQIQKAFGVRCALDISGDDTAIYVNRASDYYPIGEMFCTSHVSLSPLA